jgi:hypothetical protein
MELYLANPVILARRPYVLQSLHNQGNAVIGVVVGTIIGATIGIVIGIIDSFWFPNFKH